MTSQRAALHLLWALPIAAGIQFVSLFFAKIAWCGLTNCGPAGPDPNAGVTFQSLVLGAILAAVVLMLAPWTENVRLRLVAPIATTGAVALAALLWLMIAEA